jgi:hypothetical protein
MSEPDGVFDTFVGAATGCRVQFQLTFGNDGVATAGCSDRVFSFEVVVLGDDVVRADARTVVVRVPRDLDVCP